MVELPAPFSQIKRETFLYSNPSPIEPLSRLSNELSPPASNSKAAKTQIWIKREDSNSGLAFGGNKIRKLEYVLPDAISKGATVLVTTGGLQSNHMRQVAAAAARCGLKTHLVPLDRVNPAAPEYRSLGNIQITHLLSAVHAPDDSEKDDVIKTLQEQGEIPYWISSGASTHPLGGLGYARFAFELAQQEREIGVFFDTIIIPCNSGSTLGGMIAGFKLLSKSEGSKPRRLIGVDTAAGPPGESKSGVFAIAKTTATKIGLQGSDINEGDVLIDERWNAGKYGFMDDRTEEALKLMASLEGVLVDPVYTGKALAGLIGKARLGEFEDSRNVLFVHTGGVPVLSAYPNLR